MELKKEIENNFPKIEKFFSKAALTEFLSTSEEELGKYNYGPGTMIRLKLLQPYHKLYKNFIRNGLSNTDEMAIAVIKEYHKFMQSQEALKKRP